MYDANRVVRRLRLYIVRYIIWLWYLLTYISLDTDLDKIEELATNRW